MRLRRIWARLKEDLLVAFERDPAARSVLEVATCYPGIHALLLHRVAHFLWLRHLHLLARMVSALARFLTGVEIHPGAQIGRRVFIDHGMGVVIGETAEIGNDVLIYQGVSLGGTSLKKGKRHPTIEDWVVVGLGSTVLGPVTIGRHSRVGAGSVVVSSVPPHSTVVGVPGRIVKDTGSSDGPLLNLDHAKLPDPLVRTISQLADQIGRLEAELDALRRADSPAISSSSGDGHGRARTPLGLTPESEVAESSQAAKSPATK